jgi:hypothetical protein
MAMKHYVSAQEMRTLEKAYPIADRLVDWRFKVTEFSPGGYRAEGVDRYGRRVSVDGSNPDVALNQCAAMAKGISASLAENEGP